jgi:hypothetical protein
MCVEGTPIEDHRERFGMWVKREDLCCPPGPHFAKTRGVFAHIFKRSETVIGCLDTAHSQGGWATAQACALLGKQSVIFHPLFKDGRPPSRSQVEGEKLGARLMGLKAGRSAVLYHQCRTAMAGRGYMMPNALKLDETVDETAAEFARTPIPKDVRGIVVPASSGTIAAGVFRGMREAGLDLPLWVHLGYERPLKATMTYIEAKAGFSGEGRLTVVDEGYAYKDEARAGATPPFPCNGFYDLKAFRWVQAILRNMAEPVLFWNIG